MVSAKTPLKNQCNFCQHWYETKREHSLYCSDNCRSKAYYARKRSKKTVSSHVLNQKQLADVQTIKNYSWPAAKSVIEIATLCGAGMAEKVLDGMWDLLVQTGALDPVPG